MDKVATGSRKKGAMHLGTSESPSKVSHTMQVSKSGEVGLSSVPPTPVQKSPLSLGKIPEEATLQEE